MAPQFPQITLSGVRYHDVYGRLVPFVGGADPAALFPEVPADLTGLSREELEALSTQITERAALAADPQAEGRADVIGDLATADVIEQTTQALDHRDRITAELAARATAETEQAAALAALAERTQPAAEAEDADDDQGDPDVSDEEAADAASIEDAAAELVIAAPMPTAEEIAQAVIAAAGQQAAQAQRRGTGRVPARHQATDTGPTGPQTGLALIDGDAVESRDQLGRAFAARLANMGASRVDGEKVPVARLTTDYGDRQLTGDPTRDRTVLDRVFSRDALTGPQALTAAGGICAPPMPSYDVEVFATAERPVRASLPQIGAPRGGISYMLPLSLAATAAAVGAMTAEEDADIGSGGPENVKSCMRVECDDVVTAEIEARYRCLTIGNFDARTWPERIAAYVELTGASWARMTESRDLNAIKTASTAVSVAKLGSAWTDIVSAIVRARAGMISRHRMDRGQRFRVILPFWLAEALPVDRLQGGHPEITQARVQAELEKYGVAVTWYIDGVTGGTAQVFGAQNAGALLDFPNGTGNVQIQYAFFPEGSFAALDEGTLDLGLVRDSTLNSTNDYQLFAESFEGIAYQGIESFWISQAICLSGQVQEAGAIATCAAAPSLPELIVGS